MESAAELMSMINLMADGVSEVNAAMAKDLNTLIMSNNVDLENMTPDKV